LSEKQKALLANAKQFGTAGIAKLAGYQLKDGGFKWFQGEGQPDVNMTLMVMLVLSSVERPHEFKLDSLVKSYEFLDRQNFAPASPQGVIFSYIEAQLERVGYIYPNSSKTQANLKLQVDYAFTKASLMEKALILSILNAERSNELSRTQTGRLAQKIADDVMPVLNGKVSYEKTVWNPAQTGWDSYPGHWPTSISLVAKSLSQSKQPAFDKIKDQLKWNILQQFNGENFGSTWDTAQTLLAVGEFLNEELGPRSAGAAGQIQIALNGKKMKPADFTMEESLTGLRLVLPPAQFKPGANSEVVVTAPANYISRISLKKEIPLDQIQAQSRAWQLTRNYYRLSSKGEKTLIDPSKTKFKVGDLVFAEISFNKASNFDMWNRSRYYVLSESVPAGFIPVQEDKIYQAAPFNLPLSSNYRSREILNDQVRWYYDFSRGWMDNNSQIGIVMRASYPGTFDSGITKIEDFYDETQTSRTQSMRFTVESSAN
ncbi:MAG TPA: hypothetical protein VN132_01210, partial [Bdellovibrio sp.]|nr:hypothetical protein [Bdellovibrio sp.]